MSRHQTRFEAGAWVHLAAGALPEQQPLADPGAAFWLWRRLRRAFPRIGAACLMPDHVHLLLRTQDALSAQFRLGRILSGFTRHVRKKRVWNRVPEPSPIANREHLLRTIRYVHLNPSREKLVTDPLAWPWSTHRGAIGAEIEPWVSLQDLAEQIGDSSADDSFRSWFHRYVSSDPNCSPLGTPPPAAASAHRIPELPLRVVICAAISATPWEESRADRRRLAALLAAHQGWRETPLIAQALGITRQSVARFARRPNAVLLAAGALCLGDERLRLRPAHERALLELDDQLHRAKTTAPLPTSSARK